MQFRILGPLEVEGGGEPLALGGAKHVVSVDSDKDAIALARENFRLNGLDPADHAFAAEDAFDLLARYKKEGRRFDLVVCDPETVSPVKEDVVHDFPANGWRMRELAEGIHFTVVNGEVLLEKGQHTGNLPGRVLHNARYAAR